MEFLTVFLMPQPMQDRSQTAFELVVCVWWQQMFNSFEISFTDFNTTTFSLSTNPLLVGSFNFMAFSCDFFDYSQRHDCFFLLPFVNKEINRNPLLLLWLWRGGEMTYFWISKIEQRHAQQFWLVIMNFEISLTFILPSQNWITDICNCHLRCVMSWMLFSVTSLQISVFSFCLVKTELQISLSVVSTSHNYVADILNENYDYSKCNYD